MEGKPTPAPVSTARAILGGDAAHPNLWGEVLFTPCGRGTLVTVRAGGLPPGGFLGFHIHTMGLCSAGGDVPFSSAGGHYDPMGVPHPWHKGDLPPLLVSGDGEAYQVVYTDRFRPADVVGWSVIVHGVADDFRSQPAGDSGMRIGCGVIRSV